MAGNHGNWLEQEDVAALVRRYFPPISPILHRIPASRITTAADLIQFKDGTDARGISNQLRRVRFWIDAFAGISLVWQRRNGAWVIADGHQRLGAATRLEVDLYGNPIHLNSQLMLEEQGWTSQKVRIFAGFKNIAEGGESTSAIDVARLLRLGGGADILGALISPERRIFADGQKLSRLGNEAFELVRQRVIRQDWGVLIATHPFTPEQQVGVMQMLLSARPRSLEEGADLIADALRSGFIEHFQESLFGEQHFTESLVPQRQRIFRATSAALRRELEALQTLGGGHFAGFRAQHMAGIGPAQLAEMREQLRAQLTVHNSQGRVTGDLSNELTRAARLLRTNQHTLGQAVGLYRAALLRLMPFYLPSLRPVRPDLLSSAATRRDDDEPSLL